MTVFGTRPEAIKMCPLVKELRTRKRLRTLVCVTGQHREMLDSVLTVFGVTPDYDLSVMEAGQTLSGVTARVLSRLSPILDEARPDLVLVHGDTVTAFAAALACFYCGIAVGHVEAGLRTYDIRAPFPEEFNRRAIALVADFHFAPTAHARDRLLAEAIDPLRIYVTGNTVIDALKTTVRTDYTHPVLEWANGSRFVLLTLHRRESHGACIKRMISAVRRAVESDERVKLICPLHVSPAVRAAAEELYGCERIRVIDPLDVSDFHNLLARCYFAVTDSGGIQEEALSLGKPVLVLRDKTERKEGVAAGGLWLVGTNGDAIEAAVHRLLSDGATYKRMADARNPYGDGNASRRIADRVERVLWEEAPSTLPS